LQHRHGVVAGVAGFGGYVLVGSDRWLRLYSPLMADTQAAPTQTESTEPYTWIQALTDCTVNVPIPSDVRGRDLVVEIKKDRLLVKLKRDPKPIIEGLFHKPVKANDCFWNIGKTTNF
jgi:hypothetical protein